SGYIYVVDQDNGRVMRFPPGSDANTAGTEVATGLDWPMHIALDNSGSFYVTDYDNALVQKYPADITVAGGNGDGDDPNQLAYPAGLYVNDDGYLFVNDQDNSRIQMFPPNSTSDSDAVTVASIGGNGSDANQTDYAFGLTLD